MSDQTRPTNEDDGNLYLCVACMELILERVRFTSEDVLTRVTTNHPACAPCFADKKETFLKLLLAIDTALFDLVCQGEDFGLTEPPTVLLHIHDNWTLDVVPKADVHGYDVDQRGSLWIKSGVCYEMEGREATYPEDMEGTLI